jgi:hypothetical protein
MAAKPVAIIHVEFKPSEPSSANKRRSSMSRTLILAASLAATALLALPASAVDTFVVEG